ncbi:hypothetical protein [Jeotgalibacillus soli]|uniref:Lipoyl-binding domain-containing protein n=1 Tax=Jeotgalibacillus soli TaxID=889306 RepID=A0A0C2VLE5_9BACL|nr:hypothetical protein [Jeotgalibacillus soli]KIL45286.1 hypothetical protein KP78_28300 [Jeotgalibacillus soli]
MREIIENIYSPCHGKIEKIFIHESDYVYEWEQLISIRDERGIVEEITVGISGNIASLEVQENQEVTPETVLCRLKDDLLVTGSD